MSFEPIGIVTFLAGITCLCLGYTATVIAFCIFTVLGGAAAILVGSASIPPGHLFLAFLTIATFSYSDKVRIALRALKFPQPALWLACLLIYGVIVGYFAPRMMARMMEIIPLGSSEYPSTGGTVPLGPVSSNFTQAVYVTADLVTFLLMLACGSTLAGFRAITFGLMSFSAANLLFGVLDLISAGTPIQDLFGYIRNAQYAFHSDDVVAGVKRVVGSWPEASSFAGISLCVVGFTGTMWICGRYSRTNGFLFLMSSIMVVRSTSSTGLFGLPVCLCVLYLASLFRCGGLSGTRASAAVVLFAPPVAMLLVMIILLNDTLYRQIYGYFDLLVFSKSTSASAIERGAWNHHGLQNFLGSYGIGVGLGTARTSGFIFALLSNVGIPGSLFFGLFFVMAVLVPKAKPRTAIADVHTAARNGCFCALVGALVAGPTVDLGLLFFIMAGLAGAVPREQDQQMSRAMSPALETRR
jgi:hypothetical protein